MTGVDLPSPSSDLEERQLQLKQTAKSLIVKLDPALAVHNITYVRVVKSPKPSILEVECETVDRRWPLLTNFLIRCSVCPWQTFPN